MMVGEIGRILLWAALAGQYALGFVCVGALLSSLVARKPRWLHLAGLHWQNRRVPDGLLRAVRTSRKEISFQEREALLLGCGYRGDPAVYVLLRRVVLLLNPCLIGAWYFISAIYGIGTAYFPIGSSALALLMLSAAWDRPILEGLKQIRAQRIMKEIYTISNQLLYFSGSSLHIHTKLMRCIPYARVLRGDLGRLLGEWYHDAEGALQRFKQRIGTEEGLGFVETIDSLRQHESEEYYRLLRDRIQDYKEKLELAKESRKESGSYVLFVLAGIPILYMFQIFIYPWVQEGQKLFQSLNP
ncbi:hypothetical protein AB6A23_22915 [Paenibacillus tarimensis]